MTDDFVCPGCGAELHSEDPQTPGYVPLSALDRGQPLCRRCFRIRHYGEFSRVAVSPDAYAAEVSKIRQQPGLVLYVLDVFDLHGSLIPDLHRYLGNSEVVAVVNKTDLLPSEVSLTSLTRWIRQTVEATGVRVRDVAFVSAHSGEGIVKLADGIVHASTRNIYAVGMANVGKSTMLNRLLAHWSEGHVLTSSKVPGTTLGMVKIPVQTEHGISFTLVDTPGLIHGTRVIDMLCGDCLKTAVPSSRLRPRVFQLDPGQSLWLGGFARFDLISGVHQSIVCYVSNDLVVHRTKLERAEFIGEHRAEVLGAPCAACRRELGQMTTKTVGTTRGGRDRTSNPDWVCPPGGADIVLAGLGWVTLSGKPFAGQMLIPATVNATLRRRLLGDLSRIRVNQGRSGHGKPKPSRSFHTT